MRVVFAGTPAPALPALEAVAESGHELVAVLTRPDAAAGRGRRMVDSPVKQWAVEHGVPVWQPARPSEPEFLDRLRECAPDCVAVVAYGALVPPAALAVPAHGWVNLHFSLLPAWRGAAPVQRAVLAGDEVTGATTFRLEEGLDTGPVYGVLTTDIGPRETAGELMTRLAADGAGLLVATLDGIADGSLTAVPQPTDGVSLAPKLTVEEARVDWSAPALRVDRLVRACTPAPGAWTTLRGRRVKLGPVEPIGEPVEPVDPARPTAAGGPGAGGPAGLGPGELRVVDGRVLAGTGSAPVALGEVQPEGRSAMPAADWVRGLRLAAGDRLA